MEIQELQAAVDNFLSEHGLPNTPEISGLDLMAEVGELSKALLTSGSYGETPAEYTEEIGAELGDVFYSLILLANTFDVDLEQALEKTLEKYRRRLQTGGMGSEFEE